MSFPPIIQAAGLTLLAAIAIVTLIFATGRHASEGYIAVRLSGPVEVAEGEIVRAWTESRSRGATAQLVEFAFVDRSGQRIVIEEQVDSRLPSRIVPGTRVAVRYDPSDSRIASIKNDRELEQQQALTWIMLAALLAAGAFHVGSFWWGRARSADRGSRSPLR